MLVKLFDRITSSRANMTFLQSIVWFPIGAILLDNLGLLNNSLFYFTLSLLAAAHSVAPMMLAQHDTPHAQRSMILAAAVITSICFLSVLLAYGYAIPNSNSFSTWFFFLAIAYFVFNSWHFTMQNYGILGFLGRQSGKLSPNIRKADKIFCCIQGLLCIPLLWIPEKRHLTIIFELPFWEPVIPWKTISLSLVLVAFASYFIFLYAKHALTQKRFLYGLGMCLQTVAISQADFLLALVIYFVPHWLAELSLVSSMFKNTPQRDKNLNLQRLSYLFYFCLFLNYLIAREYPFVREWFSTGKVSESLIAKQNMLIMFSCSAFFVIVFLHYYVDRIIYRRDAPLIKLIVDS